MEERDFTWCYNHENLFRSWVARFYDIDGFYADAGFDSDSIFSLWQTAKECALEIANSKEPGLLYRIRRKEIKAKMPDNFCYIMQFLNFMLMSTKGNIMNSIFYNCSNLLETYLSTHKVEDDDEYAKIVKNANDELFLVWGCSDQINSDYDYSLPDGGIKDETEADETETDETKTKTITETEENSVDVILPKHNSLNNDDFISAMRKAIEKGLIEIIEKGKYKWKGFEDVKSNFNAALAYFIAKALKIKMELKADKTLTKDSYDDINKKFPENYDIKEVFGLDIQSVQLVKALEAGNIQKWRKAIDDFFDEET